ncbi:cbb3-type cytochrome c oxidase subunit 3 [Asticcacaulis sp. BYS171W]|uniref:Cbb3-type cytochrome c oxidase subunit 3 n=1 Tax=Asticcacaulis aquaticus TaxID=2984212 RepID=A0ABT5HZB8_9CAUL|nr:cbb3-type cytochrome c oxidase subunit 3 [Asticcacaulis aquaticus]MDC7685267.1 cbb3-type cytochrome c oxidase subunit 3 [Asticcacaulis aquaticus]
MMNTSLLGGLITLAFTLTFVSIAVWAYWPKNKAKLQAHRLIPLQDEEADHVEG